MKRIVTKIAAAGLALIVSAPSAFALPLAPGDNVSLDFQDDGTTISSFTGTIGAGPDVLPYGGALEVDLNAGGAGDGFTVTSNGNYCGLVCNGSVASMVFSGLNFALAPGASFTITGFTDTTGLGANFNVLSPTSFEITWTDPFGGGANFLNNQVAFSGTFIEVPATVMPVPLPASAPLALLGLAAFASVRRRR